MTDLADPGTLDWDYDHLIDGRRVPAADGRRFRSLNPSTGDLLGTAARGSANDVDAAIASSRRAGADSSWAGLAPVERGRLLTRLGATILAHREELALIECLDTGQPLGQARGDIDTAARYFEYYGGLADKVEGAQLPLDDKHFAFTSKEPYGVVGVIVPWNAPVNQAARSVAPALCVGNTCVVKPAEQTPFTAVRLAELAAAVGIPPGVLNVVTGFGGEAGEALIRHEAVRKISFTGSVPTGRHIAGVAAERLVPSSLELGGKSANIVFADADLAAVVAGLVRTTTRKAGQICSAATRLLVQANAVDEVVDRAAEAVSKVTIGPGLDDPMLGPLVSAEQIDRVLGFVADGRSAGARVVQGGNRSRRDDLAKGYFMEPTIFRDVDPGMRIAQEEIFGPVVSVIAFHSAAEAVAIANGTAYGLAAGVHTKDIDLAFRVSRTLEAGQVFINGYQAGGVETPFGGYKNSGWGREKGVEAINHYSQLKTTIITIGT